MKRRIQIFRLRGNLDLGRVSYVSLKRNPPSRTEGTKDSFLRQEVHEALIVHRAGRSKLLRAILRRLEGREALPCSFCLQHAMMPPSPIFQVQLYICLPGNLRRDWSVSDPQEGGNISVTTREYSGVRSPGLPVLLVPSNIWVYYAAPRGPPQIATTVR